MSPLQREYVEALENYSGIQVKGKLFEKSTCGVCAMGLAIQLVSGNGELDELDYDDTSENNPYDKTVDSLGLRNAIRTCSVFVDHKDERWLKNSDMPLSLYIELLNDAGMGFRYIARYLRSIWETKE